MSKDKKQEAVKLLALGLSQSEVAKKLGCTRQAVSYWWRSKGFKEQVEAEQAKIESHKCDSDEELPNSKAQLNPADIFSKTKSYALRNLYFTRELNLLNQLEERMLPIALEGSVRAASFLLKLSERRSKLLDLDLQRHQEIEAIKLLAESRLVSEQMAFVLVETLDEFEANLQTKLKNLNTNTEIYE